MRKLSIVAALAMAAAGCTGGGDDGGGVRALLAAGLIHTGGDTTFEGTAIFLSGPVAFDLSPADLPDGTCTPIEDSVGGGSVQPVDAGATIVVEGPAGDLTLDPFVPGFYVGSTNGGSMYVAGGTYTFSGTGGSAVGAFSQDLTAPGNFVLTAPVTSSGTITISKSAGINLTWTSGSGTDPIVLTLNQYDSTTDEVVAQIACRFDDDGSGTVAAADLAAFAASSSDPNLVTDFSIEAIRFETFTIDGFGEALGYVTNSWSAEADVQ